MFWFLPRPDCVLGDAVCALVADANGCLKGLLHIEKHYIRKLISLFSTRSCPLVGCLHSAVFFSSLEVVNSVQPSQTPPITLKVVRNFPMLSVCSDSVFLCLFVWFHCSGVSVALDLHVKGLKKAVECCCSLTQVVLLCLKLVRAVC